MPQRKPNKVLIFISRRFTEVVIGVVIFWLFLGYLLVLHNKIFSEQESVSKMQMQLEQRLAQKQQQLADIDKLFQSYQSLDKSHFYKLNRILPKEAEGPLIFAQLDALARANESILMSVQVSEVSEQNLSELKLQQGISLPPGVKVVSVEANLLGKAGREGYGFYKELLQSVENNLRLFDLENITFSPGLSVINLSGVVYYQSEN